MRIVETDWWTLALPEEWHADQDEESVIIIDIDEVSQIQITTVLKEEGTVSEEELRDFAEELIAEGHEPNSVKLAGMDALAFAYEEDQEFWREWYVRHDNLVLLITHDCDLENQGMDDSLVDEILNSLQVNQNQP